MRLMDGGSRCAGRVEIKHQEEWRLLYSFIWNVKHAAVVCRQLDCGSVISTKIDVGDGDLPAWGFTSYCAGTESALRECGTVKEWVSTYAVMEVICSGNTHRSSVVTFTW